MPGTLRWWSWCSDSVTWVLGTREKSLSSANVKLREVIQPKSVAGGMNAPSAITAVRSEKIESSTEIKVECTLTFSGGKGVLVSCPLFVLTPVCALGDLSRQIYQQPVKNQPPGESIPHQAICTEISFLNYSHCYFSYISSFEMDLYIPAHQWDWLELFIIYKRVQDTQPCCTYYRKTKNQRGLPTAPCSLQQPVSTATLQWVTAPGNNGTLSALCTAGTQ